MEKPDLNYRIPKVVIAPLEGNDAKKIYKSVPKELRVNTKYDEKSKAVIGSTNLLAAGIDDAIQASGSRTLSLRDLSLLEVMDFARNKHYLDARSLVARSQTDSYEKNNPLLKRIYEIAEEKIGNIRGPFMIEGFSYIPDGSEGYGVTINPKADFKVTQDDRLHGKYNEKTFNDADELGLPLFDRNGKRIWYARNEGLSWFCLGDDLNLGSDDRDLGDSNDNGRVVVVSAEGTRADFDKYIVKLKAERDREIAQINERYKKAEALLRGK